MTGPVSAKKPSEENAAKRMSMIPMTLGALDGGPRNIIWPGGISAIPVNIAPFCMEENPAEIGMLSGAESSNEGSLLSLSGPISSQGELDSMVGA
jgi:hypothetical protein